MYRKLFFARYVHYTCNQVVLVVFVLCFGKQFLFDHRELSDGVAEADVNLEEDLSGVAEALTPVYKSEETVKQTLYDV